jgi:hypothetical protein
MTPTATRSSKTPSTSTILNDMNALRRAQEQEKIPWNTFPFSPSGSVAMPAYGIMNQVQVVEYQVQYGWEGLLTGIMFLVTGDGGSWDVGSGEVVGTVDVDIPIGSTLATGRFVPDYFNMLRPYGSFEQPWPTPGRAVANRGWRMHPGETWRIKVYSTAIVTQGFPCFVHASLCGVVWPAC